MTEKKLCFVIGPIGDAASETRRHADWLLQGIVQPVFEASFPDFEVQRSDQISAPGSISSQIINRLHTAELVIADMSRENANAFYEMGIRHMKRLPTIHMYSEGQNIPFDVKPYRAIPFKYNEPNDLEKAKSLLKAAIGEVIKDGFVVDNPVTQARGVEKLEESATPETKVLFDQMAGLQSRVERLEGTFARREITTETTASLPGSLFLEVKSSSILKDASLVSLLEAYKTRFGAAALVAVTGDTATVVVPAAARQVSIKDLRPPWVDINDFQVRIVK